LSTYTTGRAFLEALQEAGVTYIFSNFGSDHPSIIEALALSEQEGLDLPEVIICPHEMVALSAAHAYAQVSGEPQAVLVHVECGTQNLGAAIHNAWKGRVPVLIFAGLSPYTQEGELLGSRNEFIHWIQDVPDQSGIVRGYMKYENEIRSGDNVKQIVHRALQISQTKPQGPVYLTGAREVLEAETKKVAIQSREWQPVAPVALPPEEVSLILDDLLQAKNPLIVTSYLGKNERAVDELVKLSENLGISVLESVPNYMNFPVNHPHHRGFQWNTAEQNEVLAEADVIVVIDSDVPWIPAKNQPSKDALIYYIDEDPLKESMTLWYIPSKRFYLADSETALRQLNEGVEERDIDVSGIKARKEALVHLHNEEKYQNEKLEVSVDGGITPEYLLSVIRDIEDENTVIINELISSYEASYKHLRMSRKGSIFGSGAGGLGWNGGASLGAKLADPSKTIINLTGDGCYLFSVPASVHWMSRKYDLPFLTIIFNNNGWESPKLSTLGVHPDGIAKQTEQFFVDFSPHADLAKVAEAAGGAYAKTIQTKEDLDIELPKALAIVKSGRSAVLDVYLTD